MKIVDSRCSVTIFLSSPSPSVNPSKSWEAFAHIRCVRILRVNRMSEICFNTFSPSFPYIVHFIQNRYSADCECYLDFFQKPFIIHFLISLRKYTINIQFSRILLPQKIHLWDEITESIPRNVNIFNSLSTISDAGFAKVFKLIEIR